MDEQLCPDCGRTHAVLVVPGLVLPDPSDLCPDCQDLAQDRLAAAFHPLMAAVYPPEGSDETVRRGRLRRGPGWLYAP